MMRIFLLALILTMSLAGSAQERTMSFALSDAAYISLLTCTPGDLNYNAYGHSALRVKDSLNRLDLVYNYGTFDSRIENFGWKFARGLVKYSLEIEDFNRFYLNYNHQDRSIYEQVLNLTPEERDEIFLFLTWNARGMNKYYWYDFIFNNCSSKIRDILEEETEVTFPRESSRTSFRQYIDHYNQYAEWNDLGIDLVLGARIDRNAKGYETMFLPDYLMEEFGKAKIGDRPLVAETRLILDNGYDFFTEPTRMQLLRPGVVFWAIFILFFISKLYLPLRVPPVFSVFYLTVLGLAGWFMMFMWFGTAHDATKWNLNVLWALPLHFPMAFLLFRKNMPAWVVRYFHVSRIIMITLLCVWPFFPQQFHIAVLPLMFTALLAISSNIPVNVPTKAR